MADKDIEAKPDAFLQELEDGVRKILKSAKATKSDKLSAITAGVKIAAIKFKINGGDDKLGFFDK